MPYNDRSYVYMPGSARQTRKAGKAYTVDGELTDAQLDAINNTSCWLRISVRATCFGHACDGNTEGVRTTAPWAAFKVYVEGQTQADNFLSALKAALVTSKFVDYKLEEKQTVDNSPTKHILNQTALFLKFRGKINWSTDQRTAWWNQLADAVPNALRLAFEAQGWIECEQLDPPRYQMQITED